MVILVIVFLLFLLLMGLALEWFVIKKHWSNLFLNIFYIFNMIFSSPFNVVFAVFILYNLYENSIVLITHEKVVTETNIISISLTTNILFIIISIFISIIVYLLWTFYKKIKISYQSLIDYSKIFTFRIPLLIITFGLFQPDIGSKYTVPFISLLIMVNGLYVVPLFMLFINKINFRRG